MRMIVKKVCKSLQCRYISITFVNALRTIAMLFYPDYHYHNPIITTMLTIIVTIHNFQRLSYTAKYRCS